MKILNLHKHGDAAEEYVYIEVTEDLNTKGYALVDNTYVNGKISNIHRHVFFFPSKNVLKGEFISVRTQKNEDRPYEKVETKDGRTIHRFYMGSDAPIWNDKESDGVAIIKYSVVTRNPSLFSSLKRK